MNQAGFHWWVLTLGCRNAPGPGHHLSHEKRVPSCLGYIGGYTTQLYGGYNKPL